MKQSRLSNIIRTRQTVRIITQLNEGPWRWSMGVQAGLAIGTAMGIFLLAGYTTLSPVASMGALCVLYGARRPEQERLMVMLFVGGGLVIAAAAGILSAGHEWLTFTCLLLVAGISNIVTAGTGIGPPGPVMFVLVAAISSRVAAQRNAADNSFEYIVPIVIGLGALIAWSVVALLSAVPFLRDKTINGMASPLRPIIKLTGEDRVVISRIVLCVAAAILLSNPLGITRVHWVIVAVTAILQAGLDKHLSTQRAIQRVLGTILGVIIFELVHVVTLPPFGLVAVVVLLQFATQVVIGRNYVLGLIFITPMALLLAANSQPGDTFVTARERIIDTLLGAGLAIAVFWLEEAVIAGWKYLSGN